MATLINYFCKYHLNCISRTTLLFREGIHIGIICMWIYVCIFTLLVLNEDVIKTDFFQVPNDFHSAYSVAMGYDHIRDIKREVRKS